MNILNKLTIKHLKMNKKRTIVTIIGVILSTALMVGIGLLLSTVRENSIDTTIAYNGDYHASFKNIERTKLEMITKNNQVSNYFYAKTIGYSKLNGLENKDYLQLVEASSGYLDQLKLIDGRMPVTDNEIVISNNIMTNDKVTLNIGDKLKLKLGKRYLDGEEIDIGELGIYYIKGEELKIFAEKEYTIVGIVERSVYEDYSSPSYSIFKTLSEEKGNIDIFVKYKNVKKTYDITTTIAKNIGIDPTSEQLKYNDALLALNGVSRYDNFLSSMALTLIIVLTLVSIGCVVVIYNSFAISVMERKKQFGLFSSIGATKKQLRKTVFYEAFIIGLIGIPLGILSSFIGIGTVIYIINELMAEAFNSALKLCVYPIFMVIPIIFMIIVIILSAFLPAYKASRITPIEAIRQNDDIKIKNRKLKTPKWIRTIFKVEGEIALKNMKRNKKKYRITIAALFISIVLFISFSSLMNYMFKGIDDYIGVVDYDIALYYDTDKKDSINEILNHEQVKKYEQIKKYYIITDTNYDNLYTKDYTKLNQTEVYEGYKGIIIVAVDDNFYNQLLKANNYKDPKPLMYNRYRKMVYTKNSRKLHEVAKFNNTYQTFNLCNYFDEEEKGYKCYAKLEDYYYINKLDTMYELELSSNNEPIVIIPMSLQDQYVKTFTDDTNYYNDMHIVYIKSPKYDKLDKLIEQKIENNTDFNQIGYTNIKKEMKMMNNLVLVLHILVYGFIVLVTLIGVTSVFNTINTSIALRRKEFAMLRSVGLTPKGFNRMLYFESLFVGLKALIYSIPFALLITILLHLSMSDIVSYNSLIIPYQSIIIAIVAVFLIILLSMMYASNKIKKENILEAIREENI